MLAAVLFTTSFTASCRTASSSHPSEEPVLGISLSAQKGRYVFQFRNCVHEWQPLPIFSIAVQQIDDQKIVCSLNNRYGSPLGEWVYGEVPSNFDATGTCSPLHDHSYRIVV